MKVLVTALLALELGGLPACIPPPAPAQAGAPTVLQVPQDQNPDVIWMVRPVELEREGNGGGTRTHFGLFACYRTSTPSAPKCHLAEVAGLKKYLVWPDDPNQYDLVEERNKE